VILPLGDRNRIIEAQRTERRGPDQADTHRTADHIALVILQTKAGAGRIQILRRPDATWYVDFARLRPRGRSLVVLQAAGIGIDRSLDPDFLWQEPERHLQFRRRAPIFGSAEGVLRSVRVDVARPNAV